MRLTEQRYISSQIRFISGYRLELLLFLMVVISALAAVLQVYGEAPESYLRHQSDNQGYYQWLPAVVIDHEVDTMYWCFRLANGNYLSAYTFGVALLQLPFFLLGHGWASLTGQTMNGFSAPYAYAIMLSAAVYAGLGSVLSYRLARRYCTWRFAAAATLIMFFGTNLLYYSAHEGNMSHVYSFFLVALFCWCSKRLTGPVRATHVVGGVLSFSLLVLVRQVNFVVIAFPVLMSWRSPGGIPGLWRNLLSARIAFVLALIGALIPFIGMVLYWEHVTGYPIVFSYGNKGESFEWGRMVPGRVLFDIRNGWLLYTPIMLPVLGWLIHGAWKQKRAALGVLLPVVLICLVYSAWWSWHLGTSFSHRGFVDLYALLTIPTAWMLRSLWNSSLTVRLASVVVLIGLLWLNLGLTERYTWHWSHPGWTWARLADQVGDVFTGRYEPIGPR